LRSLQSALVARGWAAQREFLLLAANCKKPNAETIRTHLAPVHAVMKEIRDAIQRGEWENHLKTVNEGAQALNWLAVEPAPRDFIESCIGGADYWGNNVRKEFRRTNPDQMAFVDGFKTLLTELMPYVKEYHTTGVSWNPRGVDVSAYQGAPVPAAATPAAVATPAPAVAPAAASESKTSGPDLFGALNKGGDITSGLKKVGRDQQTWRAEYKAGAPAPVAAPAKATTVRPEAKPQVMKCQVHILKGE
jgi:adenylyl cyclase-associated protein